MTIDLVSSCFTSSYYNFLDTKVEEFFDDFNAKNSELNLNLLGLKNNKNLLDKLLLLRICLHQRIHESAILCREDEKIKKTVYSIIALPALVLDLSLNTWIAYAKIPHRLVLISAIGVNLIYKKIILGKDFTYKSTIESLFYTFLFRSSYQAWVGFAFAKLCFKALILNKAPFPESHHYSATGAQLPIALFEDIKDGSITTVFTNARYSSPWKDYSDEKLYELLHDKCEKFKYSVESDKVDIFIKTAVGNVEVPITLLRKKVNL